MRNIPKLEVKNIVVLQRICLILKHNKNYEVQISRITFCHWYCSIVRQQSVIFTDLFQNKNLNKG